MLEIKNKKIAPFFLFGSAFLWSLSGVFTKSVTWTGFELATLRGIIAFVVAAFLLRGHKIKLNRTKLLAGACYFIQGALFFTANKYTTAANATVLQNTSPLYIILFNIILAHRRPSRAEAITCACLFGGVALAFVGNLDGGGTAGNILSLISAVFYAGVFFLNKEEGTEPLESLLIGNGFYMLFIPMLFMSDRVAATPAPQWAFILFFAVLSGICAWLCFAVGIRHTSALQANFITMAEPVLAPTWTFLFLHESISPLSIVGCVIVIGTILLYNVRAVRSQPQQ